MRQVRDAVWILFGNSLSRLASGVFTIVLARYIGLDSYGAFVIALTYGAIFSQVAELGLQQLYIKDYSQNADSKPPDIAAYFWLRFLVASLVSAVFWVLSTFIISEEYWVSTVVLVLPFIFGVSFFNFSQGLYLASSKMKYVALQRLANTFFILLCCSFVIFIIGPGEAAINLASAYGLSSIIAGAALVFVSSKLRIKPQRILSNFRSIVSRVGAFFWTGLLFVLSPQVPLLVLQYFSGGAAFGAFALAYRLPLVLLLVPMSVAQSFYPKLFSAVRDEVRYIRLLRSQAAITFCLTAIVVIMLYTFSSFVIESLLGNYDEGIDLVLSLFKILIWVLLLQALVQPLAYILMTSGLEGLRAKLFAFSILLMVPPFVFFASDENMQGVAVVALLSELSQVFLYSYALYRAGRFGFVVQVYKVALPYIVILAVVVIALSSDFIDGAFWVNQVGVASIGAVAAILVSLLILRNMAIKGDHV